jgi:predicted N-acyltransferase
MSEVRLLGSVHQAPAQAWNAVVERHGGSVFHRHEWLAALEDATLVRATPRHAVVFDDGVPRAVAPLLLTSSCPKLAMFRHGYLRAGIGDGPLLVGHSLYAQSSEILGAPAHRRLVLDEVEALVRARGQAPAALLPLVPGGSDLLAELRRRRWVTGLLSCTNLLPVRWDSFAAYLDWLPRSRRVNVRKALRRADAAGAVCAVRRGTGDVAVMAGLIRATAEHHGSPVFFDEQFLGAVLERLGPAAVVFTVRGGGRPILSCLAVDLGGELAPWCIGLDYASLATFGQYNLLYAELVRYAIEHRLRVVNFGRSTYYIKRKYGCVLRPVYAAATGVPDLRGALAGWVGRMDARARRELTELGLPEPAT